ncbi:hypothetical protein [Nitrospirillum amazonense]|uniref:hypothetical protein n=1 Tax=Nitrospirillum amazonense TaxID=28077 RepID=UPI0016487E86|nr:hypothetical protein [Nitrospirillum amazonense]
MIDRRGILQRWEADGSKRDEPGRRVFAASEARAAGWGGLAAVSQIHEPGGQCLGQRRHGKLLLLAQNRAGLGLVERPGFQKLVGAVFCIEASRLAFDHPCAGDRVSKGGAEARMLQRKRDYLAFKEQQAQSPVNSAA